jgi:hypothetical protein
VEKTGEKRGLWQHTNTAVEVSSGQSVAQQAPRWRRHGSRAVEWVTGSGGRGNEGQRRVARGGGVVRGTTVARGNRQHMARVASVTRESRGTSVARGSSVTEAADASPGHKATPPTVWKEAAAQSSAARGFSSSNAARGSTGTRGRGSTMALTAVCVRHTGKVTRGVCVAQGSGGNRRNVHANQCPPPLSHAHRCVLHAHHVSCVLLAGRSSTSSTLPVHPCALLNPHGSPARSFHRVALTQKIGRAREGERVPQMW